MELTLNHFLALSGLLFAIGLVGIVLRRNLLTILMCLELMLSAANLTLIAFARHHLQNGLPDSNIHVLVLFVMTVAAAEVAVGLALLVALFRSRQDLRSDELDSLKETS